MTGDFNNILEMLLVDHMVNFLVLSQRERQVQKEEAQELTEKLDQDWKSIQALMVKKTPKADKPDEKPKVGMDQSISEMFFILHWVFLFLFFDGH